jgi:hypothetical protein
MAKRQRSTTRTWEPTDRTRTALHREPSPEVNRPEHTRYTSRQGKAQRPSPGRPLKGCAAPDNEHDIPLRRETRVAIRDVPATPPAMAAMDGDDPQPMVPSRAVQALGGSRVEGRGVPQGAPREALDRGTEERRTDAANLPSGSAAVRGHRALLHDPPGQVHHPLRGNAEDRRACRR